MGRGKQFSIACLVGIVALTFGLVGQWAQIEHIGPFTESPTQREADQLGSLYLNWLSAECARENNPLEGHDRLISTARALEQEAVKLKRDPDLRRQVGSLVEHTKLKADLGWYMNGSEVEVAIDADKALDVTAIHFEFSPVPSDQCSNLGGTRTLEFTEAEPFFTDRYGDPHGLE